MILIIDIGNTNVTLGLYENDELGARWRVATMHERMPDEYGVQFYHFLNKLGLIVQMWTGFVCLLWCHL